MKNCSLAKELSKGYDEMFKSTKSPYKMLFDTLDKINGELQKDKTGPYFFGSKFTLADISFVPRFERTEAKAMYYRGINIRDSNKWPNINEWIEAMETRESYLATRGDFYSNVHVNMIFGEKKYLILITFKK